MQQYLDYIQKTLDKTTLMEGVAEEGAELTKAALKVIRALKYNNNFTPVTIMESYANLIEEIEDLLILCKVLKYNIEEYSCLGMTESYKRIVLNKLDTNCHSTFEQVSTNLDKDKKLYKLTSKLLRDIEYTLRVCKIFDFNNQNETTFKRVDNTNKREILDNIAKLGALISETALTYTESIDDIDSIDILLVKYVQKVLVYANELDLNNFKVENNQKWERWAIRLGYTN